MVLRYNVERPGWEIQGVSNKVSMRRYKDIIPNWDEFLKALERPMPHTLRVNTLKISPERLKIRLEEREFQVEVSPWCPYFFTVRGTRSVGLLFEYWQGYYYPHEASSMAAPLALDPQPGERVLDMCAAPGGKTTHLAEVMRNTGTIIANDLDFKRLRALSGNIYRLGITNALICNYNGITLPEKTLFDKVLVDAPCSAEGNARRSPFLRKGASPVYIRRISSFQRNAILKAIDLTRVGGVIVYSTCTFAPEENEMVIQHALENRPVRIEPINLDIPHVPGLTEWEGRRFHPDMELCMRIYPHLLDSGGAFVAKLRKLDDPRGKKDRIDEVEHPSDPADDVVGYYENRFGIDPMHLEGMGFVRRSDYLWMSSADLRMLELFKISGFGLRIAGLMKGGRIRPTDWGLVYLGERITRSRVDLPVETLRSVLLSGGAKVDSHVENGYVALCFHGEVIGSGLMADGHVKCKMQKNHRSGLYESLRMEGVL
jgi:NOL1/NOP2/sun family putative RNA methylase